MLQPIVPIVVKVESVKKDGFAEFAPIIGPSYNFDHPIGTRKIPGVKMGEDYLLLIRLSKTGRKIVAGYQKINNKNLKEVAVWYYAKYILQILFTYVYKYTPDETQSQPVLDMLVKLPRANVALNCINDDSASIIAPMNLTDARASIIVDTAVTTFISSLWNVILCQRRLFFMRSEGFTGNKLSDFLRNTQKIFEDTGTTNHALAMKTLSLNGILPEDKGKKEDTESSEAIIDGYKQVGNTFIEVEHKLVLDALSELDYVHGLLVGPSGCGKTSIPQALAEELGYTFVRVICPNIRDPEEFYGMREAKDGSTIFVKNDLITAYEDGNAIILLDEITRVEPYIANSLLPILDDSSVNIRNHEIVRGENVIILATANIGEQYVGTFALDSALRNRFGATIPVTYLPETVEIELIQRRTGVRKAVAKKIHRIITKMRTVIEKNKDDIDVSTRISLNVANLVRKGLTIKMAFKYCVLTAIPKSSGSLKEIQDSMGL